jgi:hypothetical protein
MLIESVAIGAQAAWLLLGYCSRETSGVSSAAPLGSRACSSRQRVPKGRERATSRGPKSMSRFALASRSALVADHASGRGTHQRLERRDAVHQLSDFARGSLRTSPRRAVRRRPRARRQRQLVSMPKLLRHRGDPPALGLVRCVRGQPQRPQNAEQVPDGTERKRIRTTARHIDRYCVGFPAASDRKKGCLGAPL